MGEAKKRKVPHINLLLNPNFNSLVKEKWFLGFGWLNFYIIYMIVKKMRLSGSEMCWEGNFLYPY